MNNKTKQQVLNEYAEMLEKEINKQIFFNGTRKIPVRYYIDKILFVLSSGCTWDDLELLGDLKCKANSIKKQYYRWR